MSIEIESKPVKYYRPLQDMVETIRFTRHKVPEQVWEQRSRMDVTKKFFAEIENKIQSWEAINIVIIGQAGSAKSLSGLIAGKRITQMAGTKLDIRRHVTGFLPDTVTMLSKAEPNTLIIQDEQVKRFGTGSRTMGYTHANLLKTICRYRQIHFIGIGVELLQGDIPSSVISYILM